MLSVRQAQTLHVSHWTLSKHLYLIDSLQSSDTVWGRERPALTPGRPHTAAGTSSGLLWCSPNNRLAGGRGGAPQHTGHPSAGAGSTPCTGGGCAASRCRSRHQSQRAGPWLGGSLRLQHTGPACLHTTPWAHCVKLMHAAAAVRLPRQLQT